MTMGNRGKLELLTFQQKQIYVVWLSSPFKQLLLKLIFIELEFIRFLMPILKAKFILFQLQSIHTLIPSMSQSSYSCQQESNSSIKRPYNRVTSEKKEELLHQVFKNRMKVTKAAVKIGMNLSTAKYLVKNYKKQHNIAKKKKQITPVSHQNIFPFLEPTQLPYPFYPNYYYYAPNPLSMPLFANNYYPS